MNSFEVGARSIQENVLPQLEAQLQDGKGKPHMQCIGICGLYLWPLPDNRHLL
jgi:hypothetical protein